MAAVATLYRFQIDWSDIDRGVYEAIDLRTPMHPSENFDYLLTRVFAFVLNYQDGLTFSAGGLSDPDSPCLAIPAANGGLALAIEIGNPSARRLHKLSKSAQTVKVYTYKDTGALARELSSEPIHKIETIELYAFAPRFLESIAKHIERNNKWSLMHQDGALTLHFASGTTESGEITRVRV